ncbi:phosphatase PAP2 family protein [Blautia luti]|uniref:phosphatase PAP2 family protein n=1 Tax=Blautia luti TaxID=89014 RepID=UPI001D005968|nr:phosphatase PAP2 family protein [Blautia luti]MCB5474019.1 phosphatase PAP2 family protein [Blautia luti]
MKHFLKKITRIVPAYGFFPLVFSFVFNCLVYSGSRAVAGSWYHHNIESNLDLRLPFLPQFLIIYFGCYIFWAANYILAARQDREEVYRFFTADFISRCVCLVIFLAYPTTNTRPVIEGSGFWDLLAGWLYSIDAADNLFPSIHCLVSWFCFLAVKGQKKIPIWYKAVSFILAVLVFLSTLFSKQHVIVDVAGGIFLAQGCFWIGKHTEIWHIYEHIGNKIEKAITKYIEGKTK